MSPNPILTSATSAAYCQETMVVNQVDESITRDKMGEETTYVWRHSEDLAKFAKKQLNEDQKTRDVCLSKMRAWMKERPCLANCRRDNIFLLRFLRARKFDFDKACGNLESYVKMRADNPSWFQHIDPTMPHVKELCENGFSFVLPGRDKEGRRVLFSYCKNIDIYKHTNSDVLRVMMSSIETLMEDEENQIRGLAYLFYCKDLTLAYCSIWTPADASRLFGSCEKKLGVRHSDINLVHLPFGLWAIVEFIKQLLSSKLRSRITQFSADEKLAKKFGADMLPVEAGGKGRPMAEMAAEWFGVLERNREKLMGQDAMFKALEANMEQDEEEVAIVAKASSGFWSLIPGM